MDAERILRYAAPGWVLLSGLPAGEQPMDAQRIIVANDERLVRQLLRRALGRLPDLYVDEASDPARLSALLDCQDVGWAIVSLEPDGRMPKEVEPLLRAHPQLRILGMASDGSRIKLRWTALDESELKGMSLHELLGLLRRPDPWEHRLPDFHATQR